MTERDCLRLYLPAVQFNLTIKISWTVYNAKFRKQKQLKNNQNSKERNFGTDSIQLKLSVRLAALLISIFC